MLPDRGARPETGPYEYLIVRPCRKSSEAGAPMHNSENYAQISH